MSSTTDQYYANLVTRISAGNLTTWKGQIEQAEKDRMRDRSVMDILGAVRPDTDVAMVNLAEQPVDDTITQWLQLAIEIEGKQYDLSPPV